MKPVDADRDGSLLAQAVQEHRANTRVYEAALEYEFRDDPFGNAGIRDVGFKRSPAGHLQKIQESGVAMFIRVGWQDAGTVNGAIGRFCTLPNPQRVFIGPWDHGAQNNADPFMPPDTPVEPTKDEQFAQMMEFFDTFLKESDSAKVDKEISYYTLGTGRWNRTETWPPEGFVPRKWYFAANGGLSPVPPKDDGGSDGFPVNYEATTGRQNRWFTNNTGEDVIYPDRATEDQKLLTYTSAPLELDFEITGHPLVSLQVSSTQEDGAFIAYLEDVAPDGRVTYITEGELRAIMRKISDEKPLYRKFGPHRSEKRADAMPLVPGEIAELSFDLWATSVLIRKGHRIRVAIAGADKDSLARYPRQGGNPVLTIARSRAHPSHILLPMQKK